MPDRPRLDDLGVPEPPEARVEPLPTRPYQMHDERPLALWALTGAFVAALAIGLLLSMATLAATTPEDTTRNPPPPNAEDVRLFPQPRLQASPSEELARLRRQESELLESYAWVDRQAGIARIPVERAVELLLETGLPASRPETRRGK